MELKCTHASASIAGDEYFQVLFEEGMGDDRPYLLVQRGFGFEDDEEPDPCYVETLDEKLIGHYSGVEGTLSRDRFVIRIPGETERIDAQFAVGAEEFGEIRRVLRIILGDNLNEEGEMPTTT